MRIAVLSECFSQEAINRWQNESFIEFIEFIEWKNKPLRTLQTLRTNFRDADFQSIRQNLEGCRQFARQFAVDLDVNFFRIHRRNLDFSRQSAFDFI